MVALLNKKPHNFRLSADYHARMHASSVDRSDHPVRIQRHAGAAIVSKLTPYSPKGNNAIQFNPRELSPERIAIKKRSKLSELAHQANTTDFTTLVDTMICCILT